MALLRHLAIRCQDMEKSRHFYQTAFGSSKVLVKDYEDAEDLIARVASKGGTTEAALAVFRKRGLGKIVLDAVRAALRRSRQLSGG